MQVIVAGERELRQKSVGVDVRRHGETVWMNAQEGRDTLTLDIQLIGLYRTIVKLLIAWKSASSVSNGAMIFVHSIIKN